MSDLRKDTKNTPRSHPASASEDLYSDMSQNTPISTCENTISDGETVWHTVQGELRARLGDRVHKSWTGQLTLQSENEHSVALTTPSHFVANRIEGKYGELVRSLWATHDGRDIEICASADVRTSKPAANQATARGKTSLGQTATGQAPSPQTSMQSAPRPFAAALAPASQFRPTFAQASAQANRNKEPDNRRDRFTFENFIVGPSNELAYAVARRVASSAECEYNPVVIHGPHGMGKTHLLYAIKAAALAQNPNRKVRLISSEDFVASFVTSVRAQGRSEIDAFKANLRDVDLLIIDDAHFIADKPGSQEELLHTLIALVDDGKQILLASDRHPHAINKASERLKSYLCGGLLCDIGACDYELRLRILDGLIERRRSNGYPSLAMPQNARDHLAARINATPRDLEGAFSQVVARLEFLGKPLTLESVQEALAHSRYSSNSRPTVDKIQRACAKEFNISMDEILSKRRARAIARPRQVAMYLSKTLTTRSLPDIGRRFGGRDHTTVIHAVKRIEALRAEDPALNAGVEAVIEALKG